MKYSPGHWLPAGQDLIKREDGYYGLARIELDEEDIARLMAGQKLKDEIGEYQILIVFVGQSEE